MTEPYLTMAEIEKRYANEWVLLSGTKFDKYDRLLGGRVELHAADGVAFHQSFREWDVANPDIKSLATFYIGRYPTDEILPAESEPGAA